jgi:hypothetical protein
MEIKRVRYISATSKDNSEKTTIHQSTRKLCVDFVGHAAHWYLLNNKEKLSKRYNEAIEDAISDDIDCLILVHDDVILEEDPIPKLEKLFDEYDVVGVAGASKIELKLPALWHLMGGGFQGGNLHGCVQHAYRGEIGHLQKYPSNFGPYPHRAVMIDGVFMALNREAMETLRFDENNPCKFHFYDLDFSLNAHLAGLKVGVGDILITHESPGLREFTEDFLNGERWFLNKYAGSN